MPAVYRLLRHHLRVARGDADVGASTTAAEHVPQVLEHAEQPPRLHLENHHTGGDRLDLGAVAGRDVVHDSTEEIGVACRVELQRSWAVAFWAAIAPDAGAVRTLRGQPDPTVQARPDGNAFRHQSS